MASRDLADQCWAFAGLAQACACVQSVAQGRMLNETAVLALYRALLEQQPDDLNVLVGSGGFQLGLATARAMLHRPDEQQIQALRYALAVLDATVRLRRNATLVEKLAEGIAGLPPDAVDGPGYGSWDMPWEEMADLYVATLGSLNQRVQVRGSPGLLQRPDIASKIRGLLLMGVRFAWLWHQLGGRRWHLLVNRRRMWQTTELLIQLDGSTDRAD